MAQQPERYPGMDRCLVEEVLRRMEARDGQREASTSLVVAVRARPLNSRERAACAKPCVIMHGKQVVIADPVAAAAAVVAAAGNGAEASEAVEADSGGGGGGCSPPRSPEKKKGRALSAGAASPSSPTSAAAAAAAARAAAAAASHENSRTFAFDSALPPGASQESVFQDLGVRLLCAAWQGFNCTIFAYGQTGSGKSFSITGPEQTAATPAKVPAAAAAAAAAAGGGWSSGGEPRHWGLVPRICYHLFEMVRRVETRQRLAQRALDSQQAASPRSSPPPMMDRQGALACAASVPDLMARTPPPRPRLQPHGSGASPSPPPAVALAARTTIVVTCSFLEIINETVRDLLVSSRSPTAGGGGGTRSRAGSFEQGAPPELKVRELKSSGVFVQGLRKAIVRSFEEVMELMAAGNRRRTVGETKMNAVSSRSHSIFTLELCVTTEAATAAGGAGAAGGGGGGGEKSGEGAELKSKVTLCDLAGSERQSRAGTTGVRLKQGVQINQSLSALGRCITALAAAAQHEAEQEEPAAAAGSRKAASRHKLARTSSMTNQLPGSPAPSSPSSSSSSSSARTFCPFRESKLTFLLKDSLSGNAKTLMLAAISPASDSYSETMSTLRYADQAKSIRTCAVVNETPTQKLIKNLTLEIERLKAEAKKQAAAWKSFLPIQQQQQQQQQHGGSDGGADASAAAAAAASTPPLHAGGKRGGGHAPGHRRQRSHVEDDLDASEAQLAELTSSLRLRAETAAEMQRQHEDKRAAALADDGGLSVAEMGEMYEVGVDTPHLVNLVDGVSLAAEGPAGGPGGGGRERGGSVAEAEAEAAVKVAAVHAQARREQEALVYFLPEGASAVGAREEEGEDEGADELAEEVGENMGAIDGGGEVVAKAAAARIKLDGSDGSIVAGHCVLTNGGGAGQRVTLLAGAGVVHVNGWQLVRQQAGRGLQGAAAAAAAAAAVGGCPQWLRDGGPPRDSAAAAAALDAATGRIAGGCVELRHGDRIVLGNTHFYRFKHPVQGREMAAAAAEEAEAARAAAVAEAEAEAEAAAQAAAAAQQAVVDAGGAGGGAGGGAEAAREAAETAAEVAAEAAAKAKAKAVSVAQTAAQPLGPAQLVAEVAARAAQSKEAEVRLELSKELSDAAAKGRWKTALVGSKGLAKGVALSKQLTLVQRARKMSNERARCEMQELRAELAKVEAERAGVRASSGRAGGGREGGSSGSSGDDYEEGGAAALASPAAAVAAALAAEQATAELATLQAALREERERVSHLAGELLRERGTAARLKREKRAALGEAEVAREAAAKAAAAAAAVVAAAARSGGGGGSDGNGNAGVGAGAQVQALLEQLGAVGAALEVADAAAEAAEMRAAEAEAEVAHLKAAAEVAAAVAAAAADQGEAAHDAGAVARRQKDLATLQQSLLKQVAKMALVNNSS